MPKELFNPADQGYKKVDDLPGDQRANFTDVEGGFVRKEAAEALSDAEFEREIRNTLNGTVDSGIDILHDQANEENNDRDYLLEKIPTKPEFFHRAENVEEDQAMLLAGLAHDSGAMQKASERLCADKTFALKALQVNGEALRFLSDDLKNDKEIVLAAMKQFPKAWIYASDELRKKIESIVRKDR